MNRKSFFPITEILPRLLGIAAVAISLSAYAAGQGRNSISGFVFTRDRQPIGQAPVELLNDVNQVVRRTRTNGTGRYMFTGLASGRYTIRVLTFGLNFEEQSQEVEVVSTLRPGGYSPDQAFKDFYLRPRKTVSELPAKTASVFGQEVPERARELYEKGVAELDAGRTTTGMQFLLESVEAFPEYYAALERLGTAYLKDKQYEVAQAVFTKAVSVNQRSFVGWFGLASSAYSLKRFEIAAEAAERAITINGRSFEAFLLQGVAYRGLKRFEAAEKALLAAKERSAGSSADVHWHLALLYGNNMNKFREAADELELYLKFVPLGENVPNIKKLIAKFREKSEAKDQ